MLSSTMVFKSNNPHEGYFDDKGKRVIDKKTKEEKVHSISNGYCLKNA